MSDDPTQPLMFRDADPRAFYRVDRPDPQLGYPELWWRGKRPFSGVPYYPAEQREEHGDAVQGWRNKLYWGDNLQVMGHLLRKFRGQVNLVYIDPPFDSKADYKRKIALKGGKAENDLTGFEEKQYSDIWTNDEYLQFMWERLLLVKELLAPSGTIYVHCDWHRNHHLRCLLDDVFGPSNIINECVWAYFGFKRSTARKFPQKHDTILVYRKGAEYTWNVQYRPYSEKYLARFKTDEQGRLYRDDVNPTAGGARTIYLDPNRGDIVEANWTDIPPVNPVARERTNYPTQKPEALLERIVGASSNPGDLVLDCFLGSGTTGAVAAKLGRRFIGVDMNLGAIQTSTKRLLALAGGLDSTRQAPLIETGRPCFLGLEVLTVNQYDIFRNEPAARDLLMEALAIRPLPGNDVWHGELGEGSETRLVRFMPINRIATRADLDIIVKNLDWKLLSRRRVELPNKPVLRVSLVCMGHEPELAGLLALEIQKGLGDLGKGAKLDIEVVDILRDKDHIEFKRDSHALVKVKKGKLVIQRFYPMNLLQKLSLDKTAVEDWRELVESVFVDFNYDGKVLRPTVTDVAEGKGLVSGEYDVPKGAGTIRVKITDLLSDVLEVTVEPNRG